MFRIRANVSDDSTRPQTSVGFAAKWPECLGIMKATPNALLSDLHGKEKGRFATGEQCLNYGAAVALRLKAGSETK